ncbi:MAG TPA: type II toxin-antitoxin system VapC family toxin [Dermatophilaceae bacterium]|jgi:predicted nucleic acid-binding protein|nr:type II toxin-antitoxin system VapC family toxin [Actinomycetales bacterium]HMT32307.1 type II toxin-antitoxin system VapC family toxin [Dermatophilaceae bacterium]HMT90203.1 type II toxin-antitoxin system VapC family toxin [Dermatophilaceae bacterium]HQA24355.1 type II toxin-antitoxin system VapC family toxin [Rhodoglobus sp.]
MAELREAGLLDTSCVIDLERIDPAHLPSQLAVCAITLAELSAGSMATSNPDERAIRQDRLQRTEAVFDPIPFGVEAARAYSRVFAAVKAHGRAPRRRLADLLIASVALAEGLPVLTRNPDDFSGLQGLVEIRSV